MSQADETSNGWSEYRKLVIDRLDTLRAEIQDMRKETADLKIKITEIGVRSSLLGALAGSIPAAVAIVIALMK